MKKQIKDWHTLVTQRKNQEWLIIHVIRPDGRASDRKFFNMKGSVLDKLKADFNTDKRERYQFLENTYRLPLSNSVPDVFNWCGLRASRVQQYGWISSARSRVAFFLPLTPPYRREKRKSSVHKVNVICQDGTSVPISSSR